MTLPDSGSLRPIGAILDDLTYASYSANRDAAPHISPARWAPHYPNAAELEARYQAERAIQKASS